MGWCFGVQLLPDPVSEDKGVMKVSWVTCSAASTRLDLLRVKLGILWRGGGCGRTAVLSALPPPASGYLRDPCCFPCLGEGCRTPTRLQRGVEAEGAGCNSPDLPWLQAALDFVVEEDLKAHLTCWYIQKYVKENPLPQYLEHLQP